MSLTKRRMSAAKICPVSRKTSRLFCVFYSKAFFCLFLFSAGLERDEETAEVEVKPILRSQVNISVVVEPPSSEDSSQARPARDEEEETAVARNEEQEERENEARETAIAGLGERIVEGAEEPAVERTNPGAARGTDRLAMTFH